MKGDTEMTYREFIEVCMNYHDDYVRKVLVRADTLEAQKELSANNTKTEDGYIPLTTGAGFRFPDCGQDGALGDMEVLSIGIKDTETIVVYL